LKYVAKSLIGREREQASLLEVLESKTAELVALYGRRRVGKTFLVRQFMAPRAGTYFEVTGTKGGSAAVQLRRFREALEPVFAGGVRLPDFRSWDDALSYLTGLVEARAAAHPEQPIVLFFDELPWLAAPKSRLLESLDYYWNRSLSRVASVKLVVCGSAASWMLRRIVLAKGGLHNRITRQMRLEPFTVHEARTYLASRQIRLKSVELLQLYMALGGVPYYLSLVPRGQSVAGAIGALCFERAGPLQAEFANVLASLFSDHEGHAAILRALAKRKEGRTREELVEATERTSGGSLNRRLQELEEAGFIARVEPYGKKVKSALYRVIDEYTLFYLKWIEPAPKGILARGGTRHWQAMSQTTGYAAWAGYAFESICLKHARELESALGIENLVTAVGSWRFVPSRRTPHRTGAQVDLLFERRDGVINLCEMKFSAEPFVVTKAYARELRDKVALFEAHTKTKKRVILTLVAPFGLKKSAWSEGLVEQVVDANALLR
jgi:uncharacterized protein